MEVKNFIPLVLLGTTVYLITKTGEAKAMKAEIIPIPSETYKPFKPDIEIKTVLPQEPPKIKIEPIKTKKTREIPKPKDKVLKPKTKRIPTPEEKIKFPAITPKHRIKKAGIIGSVKPLILTEKFYIPAPIVSPPVAFGGLVAIEQS